MPKISTEQTVQAQRDYFRRGNPQTLKHRINALKLLQKAVIAWQDRILAALAADMAKPPPEAYLAEISPVLHEIKLALKCLTKWQKPRRAHTPWFLMPGHSRVYHEPYGVCLIIAPWNYPFSLCMQPLVSALAAGNCVSLKPSRQAPATAALLSEMLGELFSPEFIHVVPPEEQAAVLEQNWDFIFFTGGTETGRTVMQAAAANLTPVVLELGGKSPCIIDIQLTNWQTVAKRIMWGKFFNAGQTCIAPDYVLAPRTKLPEIISHFKTAMTHMYGNIPPVLGSNYTRIINHQHWLKLKTLLESEQAKIIAGGETAEAELYIAPTLFTDVDWDSPLMQTEIFGPLLPIVSYDTLPELLDMLSKKPKPLALYTFSDNKHFSRAIIDKLSFGGGGVNTTLLHYTNPHLPFGGTGLSGMGRYHGRYGFETFSRLKPVLYKPLRGELNLQYPPYSPCKLKILRKLL